MRHLLSGLGSGYGWREWWLVVQVDEDEEEEEEEEGAPPPKKRQWRGKVSERAVVRHLLSGLGSAASGPFALAEHVGQHVAHREVVNTWQ